MWLSKVATVLMASENYKRGAQHSQGHRLSVFSKRKIISSNFMEPVYYHDNVCPQWKNVAASQQNHCLVSQKEAFSYLVFLSVF